MAVSAAAKLASLTVASRLRAAVLHGGRPSGSLELHVLQTCSSSSSRCGAGVEQSGLWVLRLERSFPAQGAGIMLC